MFASKIYSSCFIAKGLGLKFENKENKSSNYSNAILGVCLFSNNKNYFKF